MTNVTDVNPENSEDLVKNGANDLYIVGLGTSAGGLEALERFFTQMPIHAQVAFCVVQHLSPDYKSHMVELLSKYTPIPVHQAEDGVNVEGGNIYLLPPKKNMTIFKNKLYLVDYDRSHGLNLPIDILFDSLAKNSRTHAIACVLSGTGSDGTRGIRTIKEYGGMVLAQDGDSAKFDGMPRSAMNTQLVDHVAMPEQMPELILRYVAHPNPINLPHSTQNQKQEDLIRKILAILHDQNNLDFSGYKLNTLVRRIERRMNLFEIADLQDYITYLEKSANERRILVKEFLIGVTRFFRDSEAFEHLQLKIIPKLLNGRSRREQVRVWVPACSTGEEAYSLAILFQDYMERNGHFVDVKIFATDIDRDALNHAGQGVFAESVLADIPNSLLERYFTKQGDQYEILRSIRGMVVFAYQNLISDPPFSRIDLVSCRNVLIYLTPDVQNRILSTFQFALKQGGYLFLGSSESLGDRGADFGVESSKWKIYQYRGNYRPLVPEAIAPGKTPSVSSFRNADYQTPAIRQQNWRSSETVLQTLVEQMLPPCVVIDENMNIIHAFGDVQEYLRPPRGYQVNLNLMKMIPDELVTPLSIFNLEQELQFTRENLQATIEELETSNEELQATNEELMAANEELQSTNEELESVNEELLTVNNEHQIKIRELSALNDDVNNLLKSIDIGTVFLDADLKVRKFTPAAQESINLLEQDIGRPMSHFAHQFLHFDLNECVHQVLKTLVSSEYEVEHKDGRWLLLRIAPYRTYANQITGVVMTMVDITELKQVAHRAEVSNHYAHSILNSLSAQIAVIDTEGVIREVNDSWRQFAIDNGMPSHHSDVGTNYLEICKNAHGRDMWGAPECYEGLRQVLDGTLPSFDMVYPCHAPHEERWFLLRAVPLKGQAGGVVVSHINITEQKQAERALVRSEKRLMMANDPGALCLFEHDSLLNYTWVHNQHDAPYLPKDGIGKTDRDYLSRADAGYLTALKQDCLLNNISADEMIKLTVDGTIYHCRVKLDVVCDEANHPIGLIGAFIVILQSHRHKLRMRAGCPIIEGVIQAHKPFGDEHER